MRLSLCTTRTSRWPHPDVASCTFAGLLKNPALAQQRERRVDRRFDVTRPHPELRVLRRFVGVVDAGHAGDLAGARPRVEALRVAALALLQRGVDEDLEELQADGLVDVAGGGAVGGVGGDE